MVFYSKSLSWCLIQTENTSETAGQCLKRWPQRSNLSQGPEMTRGKRRGGEEDSGGRGCTKEDGMQWVNLLRIPLPCEQRRKPGRWWGSHTKGDERVRRGRGVLKQRDRGERGGVHSLNHLDLLFQEPRGWRDGWTGGGGGWGGVTPLVSLVNPMAETSSLTSHLQKSFLTMNGAGAPSIGHFSF